MGQDTEESVKSCIGNSKEGTRFAFILTAEDREVSKLC